MNGDGVSKNTLMVLIILMVCAGITYAAFVNPALGVALGIGVAVAALVWQVLRSL